MQKLKRESIVKKFCKEEAREKEMIKTSEEHKEFSSCIK